MKNLNDQKRLIRLHQIVGADGILPICRSTVYEWIASGKFPAPIKLGPRVSAWKVSDIESFIAKMEAAND